MLCAKNSKISSYEKVMHFTPSYAVVKRKKKKKGGIKFTFYFILESKIANQSLNFLLTPAE